MILNGTITRQVLVVLNLLCAVYKRYQEVHCKNLLERRPLHTFLSSCFTWNRSAVAEKSNMYQITTAYFKAILLQSRLWKGINLLDDIADFRNFVVVIARLLCWWEMFERSKSQYSVLPAEMEADKTLCRYRRSSWCSWQKHMDLTLNKITNATTKVSDSAQL